ncbi:pseudaminic acid biosynthesis-associated methylase [Changchengzhania lutea]|uniref:pseudaminic acid biosynthesis-associated methylase n=1 Tax=Changchengzhania lutea TaxID=2049305 RepID=UPI00115ED463|nr:pseudaminic acid biosynthesis-associated methylase [Changchengzhania lutea]
MGDFKTEQEKFWATEFGNDYIDRNKGAQLLASNLVFFTKCLQKADKINSCREFGANIGMNMKAFKLLYPSIQLKGVEINETASKQLATIIGQENVFNGSIYDAPVGEKVELSLIKGVLIHINPDMLPTVYDKLYKSSSKYILIAEYYNPSPVAIPYRGHSDRLFKRDFAGEFLDTYKDVKLIDYGFAYRRDPAFPQDDITWFLMEKI